MEVRREPVWVSANLLLAIHNRQVSEHGGAAGLRDQGLPESVLARPRNLFAYDAEADLAALAASLAHSIVKNHPFVDGNKRVSLVACDVFLRLNGWDAHTAAQDEYSTWSRLAGGQLSVADLAAWIRARLVRKTG